MQKQIKMKTLQLAYLGMKATERVSPQISGRLANFIWFRPLFKRPHASRRKLAETSDVQNIQVHGRKISLRSWGVGDPAKPRLVLVHGWGGRWDQFADFIPYLLEQGYHVTAFDFPAHGETTGFSTDVLEMIEVLQAAQSVIGQNANYICHSFGFIAVANAVIQNRVQASKLIALNSPHRFLFLVDQFTEKVRLADRVKPHLLNAIRRRLKSGAEQLANVSVDQVARKVPLLFVADINDTEVPWTEHRDLEGCLNGNFVTTEGLGHNGILRHSLVHNKVHQFLNS